PPRVSVWSPSRARATMAGMRHGVRALPDNRHLDCDDGNACTDDMCVSVVLNGEPLARFTPPTRGCLRKVNVHVVHGVVNRLKLRAAGTVNGARRSALDAFICR